MKDIENHITFEVIHLERSLGECAKIIEMPHQKMLLEILNSEYTLNFYLKSTDSTSPADWDLNVVQNQNIPEFFQSVIHPETISSYFDNKGDLILFIDSNSEEQTELLMLESHNYGKTWNPHLISPEFTDWKLAGDPIIIQTGLRYGNILIPIYDKNTNRSLTLFSEDNGRTWHQSLFVEPVLSQENTTENLGLDEEDMIFDPNLGTFSPHIAEMGEQHIALFCWIAQNPYLSLYQSSDLGATWHFWKHLSEMEIDRSAGYGVIGTNQPVFNQAAEDSTWVVYLIGMIADSEGKIGLWQFSAIEPVPRLLKSISIQSILDSETLEIPSKEFKIFHLYLDNSQVLHGLIQINPEYLLHLQIHPNGQK